MSWCSCFLLICHWSKSDIRADKCCKVAFFLESSFSSTFFSNASCLALRVRVSERTLKLLWFKNSLARFSAISKDFIWTSNTCLRQDWNLDSNSCLRLSTLENRWWSGPLQRNVHHVMLLEHNWQQGKAQRGHILNRQTCARRSKNMFVTCWSSLKWIAGLGGLPWWLGHQQALDPLWLKPWLPKAWKW